MRSSHKQQAVCEYKQMLRLTYITSEILGNDFKWLGAFFFSSTILNYCRWKFLRRVFLKRSCCWLHPEIVCLLVITLRLWTVDLIQNYFFTPVLRRRAIFDTSKEWFSFRERGTQLAAHIVWMTLTLTWERLRNRFIINERVIFLQLKLKQRMR